MMPRFKPVAILPTLCTLGNTFCGFLAIAKIADALLRPALFEHNVLWASWMILLAMLFDALDGRIARLTKQSSDFGAQLDSLTDLITFGVAPAFLVKVVYEYTLTSAGVPYRQKFVLLLCALYVICAALRLARFTLETDEDDQSHERFCGLPTPAAAGVVASSAFLLFENESPLAGMSSETRLALVRAYLWMLPLLGGMMISRVEYVHLVSRWFRGRRPFLHLVVILVILFLAATYHETLFFLCFAGYAVAGPLLALAERMAGRRIFAPHAAEARAGGDEPGAEALVALGSNLGDREAHIRFALGQLRRLRGTEVVAVSELVETEPVGGPAQRPFLNGVALLDTALPPEELLRELLKIEARRGRDRSIKNGPRVLDLDLILHGRTICETRDLTLPHPRYRERGFVLEPAAAVAPDMVDPVTGKTIRELLIEQRAR